MEVTSPKLISYITYRGDCPSLQLALESFSTAYSEFTQGRHLRGAGGRRPPPPPQGKRKKKKRKKKREKKKKRRKRRKKRKKEKRNHEYRQITTYKVLFFSNFSKVRWHGQIKKISAPPRKVEMTPLNSHITKLYGIQWRQQVMQHMMVVLTDFLKHFVIKFFTQRCE